MAQAFNNAAEDDSDGEMQPDFDLNPATLGARIQRLRLKQGLSIRDVADKAEVDKNTVMRLEKGLPTSARTRDRIGLVLGTYISRLTLPEPDEHEVLVHHSRDKEIWWPYPGMGEPYPLPSETGFAAINDSGNDRTSRTEGESEEIEQATRGFVTSLACRMPRGRMRSSLIKVYAETTPNTHTGEEFVFCLRGAARITVSGKPFVLQEGDAASFWSAEPHTYAPASGVCAAGERPTLLLSVWIDAREERK